VYYGERVGQRVGVFVIWNGSGKNESKMLEWGSNGVKLSRAGCDRYGTVGAGRCRPARA
jgi:hypothetical protein